MEKNAMNRSGKPSIVGIYKWTVCLLILLIAGHSSAAAVSPDKFIKVHSDKVLTKVLSNKEKLKANPKLLYNLIRADILPYIDFVRMSRSILGKHWRKATKVEQKAFSKEFTELLIRTYGTALLGYSGQEIEYKPAQLKNKGKVAIVRTKVPNSGSAPVSIDYRLYDNKNSWKVVDIKIGSVSLVSNYRTNFAAHISRNGLGDLIRQLQEKNRGASKRQ